MEKEPITVNGLQNLKTELEDLKNIQRPKIVAAIASNEDYIKSETLTEEIQIKENLNNGIEIAFDDVNTKLFIKKH